MDNATVFVTPKVKLTAREFFLWAGIVLSLYASVSALLVIVFTTLDKVFPDSLDGGYFSAGGIGALSVPISIVIILFPIFTLLTVFANRIFRKSPERAALGFRKFVIWLTLFLAAALVATDLITLVHYFLSGEITTRFLLKVLVILVTAGLVGWYFIHDLKRDVAVHTNYGMYFGITAWALVVLSFVFAFATFGSPQSQRSLTLDTMRVSALQEVERNVASYWQDHGKMPRTLAEMSGYGTPRDPEAASGKVLEYSFLHDTTYTVCATFSAASSLDETKSSYIYDSRDSFLPPDFTGDAWTHPAGHACFTRVIDTAQYPINPKTP